MLLKLTLKSLRLLPLCLSVCRHRRTESGRKMFVNLGIEKFNLTFVENNRHLTYKLTHFCPHVKINLCVIGWIFTKTKNIWRRTSPENLNSKSLSPVGLIRKCYAFRENLKWRNTPEFWGYMALSSLKLFYFRCVRQPVLGFHETEGYV